MKFGLIALPDVAQLELAITAEECGFDSFWVGENPLMWSDPYVTLALVAERTKRIRIGPGVCVASMRLAPVAAQSVTTLNLLAPGRVFCGVGTGNSALRMLGRNPMTIAAYEEYLRTLQPLVAGEEVELREGVTSTLVHHAMDPQRGFVSFEPRVPLYVSGFGPRSMALAGRYGDGLVGFLGSTAAEVEECWASIRKGAAEGSRDVDPSNFYTGSITTVCVLEEGEAVDSDRARAEVGPVAMLSVHLAYEQERQLGTPPPAFMEAFWDDYVKLMEKTPSERRAIRIHLGHGIWVPEDEQRFVTAELIEGTSMIGTAPDLARRLGALRDAGLSELLVNPPPDHAESVMHDISEKVMPLLV